MKLFLSWSKARSRRLALALREWLPDVVHRVDPWMSSEDIVKGQAWMLELASQLRATGQGIICVTRENYNEPWLNFEAGALAKSMELGRVRPILFDLSQPDLVGPLAQFQTTVAADGEDMLKLVRSINVVCETPVDDRRLERSFTRAWPDLEAKLADIARLDSAAPLVDERPTREKIDEMLTRLRTMERSTAQGAQFGLHSLQTVPSVISIDVSALDADLGSIQKVVDFTTTVDDLLDHIWYSFKSGTVPAFTYGKLWALRHHDQAVVMKELGAIWANKQDQSADDRLLEEVGISLDARLVIVRLPRVGPELEHR